ncbi:uncharacterized protein BDR25DRAFT_305931 [Lindgomyces ingoldianus]|uniref:Uncharacterized protein n=1 Tax=Lindgomyces ingoldianus TaxID=673940 RepID=A0ACB6QKQ8_9PLEO|nr:uncharacterized protein BDR25DRAFT_305931 [Lindgomyces ingoldianus]KAF2466702.1 hypothetical protein BDR25DRAFT_305931 [Lindgomyces ingoldianus]
MVNLTTTTPTRKGLRIILRKWRERLKKEKKSGTQGQAQAQAQAQAIVHVPQTSGAPPPPPALFPATTTTTIISTAPDSKSPAASRTTLRKPTNPRRNTAPADFFSAFSRTVSPTNVTSKSRFRTSISKRLSIQPFSSSPTNVPSTGAPLSPTPSAPLPHEHPNNRNTFQFTTAAEIAAQAQHDAEKLVEAVEVIRRDKPKDWMDPGWREKEAKLKAEEEELMRAGGLNLGRDGLESGPLKRWEWGR